MLYSSSLLRCIADSFRLLKYLCVGGVSPCCPTLVTNYWLPSERHGKYLCLMPRMPIYNYICVSYHPPYVTCAVISRVFPTFIL